jgi:protein dithiol oxidoreductase (disulfide-forming)
MYNTLSRLLIMFIASMSVYAQNIGSEDNINDGAYGFFETKVSSDVKALLDNRIAVFFQFTCPYCAKFDPMILKWSSTLPKSLKFEMVPAVTDRSHIPMAMIYYALEELAPDDMQNAFEIIHDGLLDGGDYTNAKYLVSLLSEAGFSYRQIEKAIRRKDIKDKAQRAYMLSQKFKIESVPMVILDGSIQTTPGYYENNYGLFFQVLNGLVSQTMMITSY